MVKKMLVMLAVLLLRAASGLLGLAGMKKKIGVK